MNISIMNTYAPNNNEENESMQKYRNDFDKHIGMIPNKYIKIWCTDNNAQIARNKHNNKVVGKWTSPNSTQKGNGVTLSKTCVKNEMVCVYAHTSSP